LEIGAAAEVDVLEKNYDEFINKTKQLFPNIDANLLVKALSIERKWPKERLRFYLTITYKNGIDTDMKDRHIYSLTKRLPEHHSYNGNEVYQVDPLMTLETLKKIAEDRDIILISGDVSLEPY
jgi:hypothetical protein